MAWLGGFSSEQGGRNVMVLSVGEGKERGAPRTIFSNRVEPIFVEFLLLQYFGFCCGFHLLR